MRTGDRRLNFRESYHYRPSFARQMLHVALALAAFGLLVHARMPPAAVVALAALAGWMMAR